MTTEQPEIDPLHTDDDTVASSIGGQLRLKSDRHYQGDPRQIEFAAVPDATRIRGAADALADVASSADGSGPADGDLLRVCLTLIHLPPGLPFKLFGFNLVNIDKKGRLIDQLGADQEILYALVVNQPVAVLRETAIRFLLDFVRRQAPVMQAARGQTSVEELPKLVAQSDAVNADLAADLPPEVPAGISLLGDAADESNVRLRVRFQIDPFPSADQVARRMRALRHLYNSDEAIRIAVDKTVSAFGGNRMSIRGGVDDIREFIGRRATLHGWRQYTNQTLRDGIVCGGGYMHLSMVGLESRMRCLRPEAVTIANDGDYWERPGKGRIAATDVAHLPGLPQINAPYGLSWLEPFLFLLSRRELLSSLTRVAQSAQAAAQSEVVKERIEGTLRMAKQLNAEADRRRDEMLSFFGSTLPDASKTLYFPGQELM